MHNVMVNGGDKNVDYVLELREDTLRDEDGTCHTVYGINVVDTHGVACAFSDISFDKERVRRLMDLCRTEQVARCHLPDVVRDVMVEQYLL